jgi:FO synthase
VESALERVARDPATAPLSDPEVWRITDAIADASGEPAGAVRAAARSVRDALHGRVVTYSPKVFLPLTNLCRNHCDYCSFRRSPGDLGEWTMTPAEIEEQLVRARELGCTEALFCLGDKPERAFSAYRRTLASWGQSSTVDYLHWAGSLALKHGLLPHTNAGLLTDEDMVRLKDVNVSLGLMLECSSARLCQPGMPHHRAPDKRPDRRLAMIEGAGRLRIPFTTGILVGIGETLHERVESLLAIRRAHRMYGHVQEVIVQNFRAVPGVPMEHAPEPGEDDVTLAVAMARLILDADVSLQAPPNLNPAGAAALLASGLDDFGGISPLTPDYINPRHPWPHLDSLGDACARAGFALRPRAAVYARYLERPGFLQPHLLAPTREVQARLGERIGRA